MKKMKKLLLIASSIMVLCSCNGGTPSESSPEPSSESLYSSLWGEQASKLLKSYCGSVLPYPSSMGASFSCSEKTLSDGTKYLEIKEEADSFTLKDYYKELTNEGWSLVKSYGEKTFRVASSLTFVELNKTIGEKGYDVTYYYQDGANLLTCYNNLSPKLTGSKTWANAEKEAMKEVLTEEVPFLAMGEGYSYSGDDSTTFLLTDLSTVDLRGDYSALLQQNGYALNEKVSLANDLYYLTKTLEEGSTIVATLDYTGGNYFKFVYQEKKHKSSSWPSDALKDIEAKSGLTIPSFKIKGNYYYLTKNGKVTIYGTADDNVDYNTEYGDKLDAIGMVDYDGYGQTSNWEETLSLSYGTISTSSSTSSFALIAKLTEPTSTFTASWPEQAISSFYKKLGIDIAFPSPSFSSLEKSMKYTQTDYQEIYDEAYAYVKEYAETNGIDLSNAKEVAEAVEEKIKETIGFDIYFYDKSKAAYDTLDSYFYKLGYHKGSDIFGDAVYEDPTGKAAIAISRTNRGLTKAHFSLGSGQAHEEVFAFEKSEMTLGVGTSTQLVLNIEMLPYEVAYALEGAEEGISITQDGLLTIPEGATIGKEFTVKATIEEANGNKRSTSCKIKVASRSSYDPKTAMEAVVKLLIAYTNDDDLQAIHDEEEGCYWVIKNVLHDKSVSDEDGKSIIETKLIPEEFVSSSAWESSVSEHGFPVYTRLYEADGVTLECSLTSNDGIFLFDFKSYIAK